MPDNETPHPDYLKGFNEGYTMQKHLPELSEKLTKSLSNSERSIGFKDGRQEFILEQEKDHYPSWLKSDRLSSLNKSKDKSKEKDKDDLDRE